ncbi:fibrillin-2-like [Diprion similis]|uniref:fibrillin-2-like n=1 Tax=Diprion similis TaxID=362088 RepID=UPI001EF9201C|nr:fibrillin-2-like [Diprion similis]
MDRAVKRMASAWIFACCVWIQLSLDVLAVETEMESRFEHCCGLGSSWAGEGLKCETFTGPVAGVAAVEQGLCLSAVDICCIRAYHEKQCELGKSEARAGLACVGNSNLGGDYHRDCCEGCKLGILTGSMGQGCAFKKFAFGKPWDPAFLECCHEALPSTTEPLTMPGSSTVSFDPTSKSTMMTSSDAPYSSPSVAVPTADIDDICILMKGLLCSDICITTPGSYKCACREGFTLLEDGKTCRQDSPTDRCKVNNPCEHRCTDTGEAILCSCNPGYVLANDKHSCQIKQADTTPQTEDNESQYKCPVGYQYKSSKHVCDDVDECEQNLCPGECKNTIGSYKCLSGPPKNDLYEACPPGYVWETEEALCVDIDECFELPEACNKETHVCVNTQGSFTCHELTGTGPRSCPAGFKFDTKESLCKDVDECTEGIDGCLKETEECRNTDGGYECDIKCAPGFTFGSNIGSCIDIDECANNESQLCPTPGSRCVNTVGGYECVNPGLVDSIPKTGQGCIAGYKTTGDPTQPCVDVDECMEGLHSCNENFEKCINEVGSYRCDPTSESQNETDISEEDFDESSYTEFPVHQGTARKSCVNPEDCGLPASGYSKPEILDEPEDVSKAEPTCLPGYQYNYVTDRCNDIDECSTNQHNCTGPLLECVNLPATYRCDCRAGYELNITTFQCQDIDECARGLTKCSSGERCINSVGGHQCAPACQLGFQPHPTDESLCQDVDECELGIHSCPPHTHVCVNTNGSHVCDIAPPCNTGYKRDEASGECIDIDECSQGPGCREHERCVNIPGSYDCVSLCHSGWLYNPLIKNCQDVDECLLGRHNCPQDTHSCRNIEGSFVCDPIPPCANGFWRLPNGECADIDECTENVHNCLIAQHQYCVNRVGSFECITRFPACDRGYEFSLTSGQCQDIDECGSNQHSCDFEKRERCVNLPGTYRCERPTRQRTRQQQRTCPSGYRYDNQWRRCLDIDECTEGTHTCGSGQCFNQPGSYTCARAPTPIPRSSSHRCGPGARYTRLGCEDIDECSEVEDACTSTEDCANTPGSFMCTCKRGFNRDNVTQACVDINECQIQKHNCLQSQRCDNTIGSFTCVRYLNCGTGYTLNAASEICEDDDECMLGTHDCAPGYRCRNTLGSYRCDRLPRQSSSSTSTVSSARFYSIPITTTHEPFYIRIPSTTRPTISISCPPGYRPFGGQCVDEDECERFPAPCSHTQRCVNTVGSYRCMPLMICRAGYKLDQTESKCLDIDECVERSHDCGPQQTCENRPGGYMCSCPPGHKLGSNKDCVDINECELFAGQICSSNSKCLNTVGSYRCICDTGFENVGDTACQDIDECKQSSRICQHKCINTWGSYTCTCNPGYRINLDNRSCSDIDECLEFKENNLCVGICQNNPGSYSCQCPRGYHLGSDGRTCQDIDECETGNVCRDPEEMCQNTRGHYRCNRINCPPGYYRDLHRKNRCLRTSRYCQTGDMACLHSPSHFSYNFMSFVSMLPIPQSGQIELFTMRGTGQSASSVDFRMELVNAQAPPGVQRATESCFRLRRPALTEAIIVLTQSIQGPQEIELNLTMEIYSGRQFAGSAVVKLFIFVSEYEF